jgi:hypothetical protein
MRAFYFACTRFSFPSVSFACARHFFSTVRFSQRFFSFGAGVRASFLLKICLFLPAFACARHYFSTVVFSQRFFIFGAGVRVSLLKICLVLEYARFFSSFGAGLPGGGLLCSGVERQLFDGIPLSGCKLLEENPLGFVPTINTFLRSGER